MAKVIGCPSTSFNDYVTPLGSCQWTPFTFAARGADSDGIVDRTDAPTEITVFGSRVEEMTGEIGNPAWTWTDWAPIQSSSPDPRTGMRVLMLRALVPSGQTICFANSQLRSITGNVALNRGFDLFIGGIKFDYDMVTNPGDAASHPTQVWLDNQLTTGSLFPIVQFLTRNAGIVGATTGDSHHQGTSTTDQFTNYLYRATAKLGSRYIGHVPFGMVNCAVGGLTSAQFFCRMETLLPLIQPTYVILPGWTFNDRSGSVHADRLAVGRFMARLLQMADLCERSGVLPIFLTPFPRNAEAMSPIQVEPWREQRSRILGLRSSGAIVVDAGARLGHVEAGEAEGTYQPGMSDDGAHPNDEGHAVIAADLVYYTFGSNRWALTQTASQHSSDRS